MDSNNLADPTGLFAAKPARELDKWGVVLRIGFFVFLYIVAGFLVPVLNWTLGKLVAGALGLCLAGLLANWLTLKIFDRRGLADIGLEGGRLSARNFVTGLVFGGGTAALMLLVPILAGAGHFAPKSHSDFSWSSLANYLVMIFLAAAGEEMIFRGYAFQLLIEKIGAYATVLPMAVLFGVLHTANPGATLLSVFNTILWGAILGYAFVRSHDLWLPIGLHFGWNAVLPLFGVNLSGLTIDLTRYEYQWDILPLWSGGVYGPEGGLLCTVFAVAVFFALVRTPIKPQMARIAISLNEEDPLAVA